MIEGKEGMTGQCQRLNTSSTKILLIEDSHFDILKAKEMIAEAKSAQFDVELECAGNLESGLARLAMGGIEAVLLDLGLTDSHGLNTLVRVNAQALGVPIIVLTGIEDEKLATEAVNKGAQDYLVKSQVDSNLLKRSILYAIERKRLEKVREEFSDIISHELRTPLSMIKESITLMLDRVPGEINEQQSRILSISKENIDRLARLINDLLDMSTIESGKLVLIKKRLEVLNLIKEAVSIFEARAKEKGLELRINHPERSVEIYADEDKIIQVLIILIDNAIKFTSKGYIEINILDLQHGVEISVEDTGMGISKKDLPRVFDKFTQFGRESGPGKKGTGLGLSIAMGIMKLHRGEFWVKSELGRGTIFAFSLAKLKAEKIFR